MNEVTFVFDYRNATLPVDAAARDQFLRRIGDLVRSEAAAHHIAVSVETPAQCYALPARNNTLTGFPTPAPEPAPVAD